MSADVQVAPPAARATSLRAVWPAILGLSVVFLVEMLDNSVLNVALPTIARDLSARRRPTCSGSPLATRCCSAA
jgi:hypothetical protein